MPRSSGTYSLPAGNPVVSGSVASSSVINTTLDDLGDEITNSIPRDGTAPPTADIPFGNFKITGLGDATADTDALNRESGDSRYGYWKTALKTATTSRPSTTTLADDPHLSIALTTGTWAVDLWFPAWATTSGIGGFQAAFAFSGTSTSAAFSCQGVIGSVLNTATFGLGTALISGSSLGTATGVTAANWCKSFGMIVVTAGGNLTLQWAQFSSSVNAANVGAGAWMTARKIA